jgi:hypothetical protein
LLILLDPAFSLLSSSLYKYYVPLLPLLDKRGNQSERKLRESGIVKRRERGEGVLNSTSNNIVFRNRQEDYSKYISLN